jgi:UDP-N-acetylmuramyl pentapeptide phosphotransferase/UDP-N-acetylglucosamine-1-phosphate transferase
MDINYFFIISLVFAILFIISKKFDFFNDDISYSNHKIIGAENRSPLVIGGIFFVIVFLYFNPYSSINFNITILLITFLGLMSDKNIFPNPSIRLVIQILILLNFVYFAELQINDVRIDLLNRLLSNNIFNIFFTVFCLAILINGTNFLDGLNGLVSGYYLIVLLSIIYLIDNNFNIIEVEFLKIVFLTLTIFYIFNILGFVYLGDSGSYLIAFVIGVHMIELNEIKYLISPYYIVSLLWYPAFENLFSFLRRVLKRINVSNADNMHLHQLLYLFIESKKILSIKILNSVSSLIILFLNIPGIVLSNLYISKSVPLLKIIFVNIFFYLLIYYFLAKSLKRKK